MKICLRRNKKGHFARKGTGKRTCFHRKGRKHSSKRRGHKKRRRHANGQSNRYGRLGIDF